MTTCARYHLTKLTKLGPMDKMNIRSLVGLTMFCFLQSVYVSCEDSGDAARQDTAAGLIEEFWQWRLRENPDYGTRYGFPLYENKLELYNEDAFRQRKHSAELLLSRVKRIPQNSMKGNDGRIALELIKTLLQAYIDGYRYRSFSAFNDIRLEKEIKSIVKWMHFDTEQAYRNLLARYNLLPRHVSDRISLMRLAIKQKTALHNVSIISIIKGLSQLEVAPESSVFYSPFKKIPSNINQTIRLELQRSGKNTVRSIVLPQFKRFKEFLEKEYAPNTRANISIGSLENGLEHYQQCLKWHLTVSLTADEVHQIGLKEVARVKAEVKKLIHKEGHSGDFRSFIRYLRNRTDVYYKTETELLNGYKELVNKAEKAAKKFFKQLPTDPVAVVKSPTPYYATGQYRDPSLDGKRKGTFLANAWYPTTRPKFNMMALTLHETVPGHHTQAVYAMREGLANFRRAIEYKHYLAVPFNWLFFSAYSEGWGLYAEALGVEMGVYDEPFSLFGRYMSELFRAARLVLDTGIHAKGWSREKAIQYLTEHSSLPATQVEYEINRYVTMPAQACSYKIGEIKIKELRKRAEDKLGAKFDLREFHHQVLKLGSVPLDLLSREIDDWVASEIKKISGADKSAPAHYMTLVMLTLVLCLQL